MPIPAAAIITGLTLAQELFAFLREQGQILKAEGDLTPAQIAAIDAAAETSDVAFDDAIVRAKERIAARGAGGG